jgi:hypothetical protein
MDAKYYMPKWEDSIYFESLNHGTKRRETTLSDELTVPWKMASVCKESDARSLRGDGVN